jgi:transcriptional regulator with GAF, ATPase, and Fis domain
VVAATHRDLEEMVFDNEFRADLYYRLNVFPISIPPLRDRPEDIPVLAEYFVRQFAQRMRKTIDEISPDTIDALTEYFWPVETKGRISGPPDAATRLGIPASTLESKIKSLKIKNLFKAF